MFPLQVKLLIVVFALAIPCLPLFGQTSQHKSDSLVTVLQELLPIKKGQNKITTQLKSEINKIGKGLELYGKPGSLIKIINAEVFGQYNYYKDVSPESEYSRGLNGMAVYEFSLNASILDMPFDIRVTGNNFSSSIKNAPFNNFQKLNFDHKGYLNRILEKSIEKIDPEIFISNALRKIERLRQQHEQVLKSEIQRIKSGYEQRFEQRLVLPENLSDLSFSDLAGVHSMLFNKESLEDYKSGREINFQSEFGQAIPKNLQDSVKRNAESSVEKMKALEEIYARIEFWKTKFENDPTVSEIRNHMPFSPDKFRSYLSKPSNLVDVIREKASLSGIQQLFMNVTKLDMGVNPVAGGDLNMQNLMNQGLNLEVTGKKSSAGLIVGSGKANVNNWLQSGLTSLITNEYSSMIGFKVGSGWNNSFKQSISLNFFDFNSNRDLLLDDPTLLQPGYLSQVSHRDAVITWQSEFEVKPGQRFSVDLSRSIGSYKNNLADDSTEGKSGSITDILGESGQSNYAARVQFDGDLLNTDVGISLRKVGLGYNNPGNVFLRRGETRIGLNLRRKLFKNKLSLAYKIDWRSQHFDPLKMSKYNSLSNEFRLGIRYNRYSRVGVSVKQAAYDFVTRGSHDGISGSSLIINGNASYRVNLEGKKLINFTSLGVQQFNMPMITGQKYTSRAFTATHTSSLPFGKNMLTATLIVNHSDNTDYLLNTSFLNSELSYSYALFEILRMNSGIGYYKNNGWNRQVGVTHQISGTVIKKLEISVDLTMKRAFKILRPELANQFFLSSTIHYRF